MFEYDKSSHNPDQLRRFVLEHSLNQMDDMARIGRIGLDEHAMASCVWKLSRDTWENAREGAINQHQLGFISNEELTLVLSALAEICPSRLD